MKLALAVIAITAHQALLQKEESVMAPLLGTSQEHELLQKQIQELVAFQQRQ